MKVAYILFPEVIVSNRSNGVRSQAETWAEFLRGNGVEVDFINNWDNYQWTDYDAIHLFGGGMWCQRVAMRLQKINPKIIWSPIVDPQFNFSYSKVRLKHFLHKLTFGLVKSRYVEYADCFKYCQFVCVRSMCEKEFIKKVYGVPESSFSKIPLSYSISCRPCEIPEKEPMCLHISSIYQSRKNVIRLIEAAKKYKFKLVLAGNKGTEAQYQPIKDAIGDAANIEVLGFISEQEKIDLYKRAKVFALPSLSEGVGIVAVDAAYYGAEIVITNIDGPKEYYDGKCIEVNPTSVDGIGRAIKSFLSDQQKFQPELSKMIAENYSAERIVAKLINLYKSLK